MYLIEIITCFYVETHKFYNDKELKLSNCICQFEIETIKYNIFIVLL